ncbi:MAG: ScpA family protein [Candidatus Woesearchaeota archaeon]
MEQVSKNVNEEIFSILFEQDEVTWQTIIYDLVNKQGMDPWNINVSLLAGKFLQMLNKLKEVDFRISGKMILAAAFLLKMKSNRLLQEDIEALDALINGAEAPDEILEELEVLDEQDDVVRPRLIPRSPQPRKRKVSVFDLVSALEKALEVEERRKIYLQPMVDTKAPEKTPDISVVMSEVYKRVKTHYDKKTTALTFSAIIPSEAKEDKVMTFIPLLHLENQRSISMDQKIHFGTINIFLEKATKKSLDGLKT